MDLGDGPIQLPAGLITSGIEFAVGDVICKGLGIITTLPDLNRIAPSTVSIGAPLQIQHLLRVARVVNHQRTCPGIIKTSISGCVQQRKIQLASPIRCGPIPSGAERGIVISVFIALSAYSAVDSISIDHIDLDTEAAVANRARHTDPGVRRVVGAITHFSMRFTPITPFASEDLDYAA